MERRAETRPARNLRFFANGLLTGLSAPMIFMMGGFEAPLAVRRNGLDVVWRDVGSFIRFGIAKYDHERASSAKVADHS